MKPTDRPYITLTAGNNDPDMAGGASARAIVNAARKEGWPVKKLSDKQILQLSGFPVIELGGPNGFAANR